MIPYLHFCTYFLQTKHLFLAFIFCNLLYLFCVKLFCMSEIIFTNDEHVFLRILVTNLCVLCFDIYAIPTMWTPYYQSRLYLVSGLRDGLSWVTDVTTLQSDRTWLFFSCPLYFFPHSFSSSYFLPLFHCLITILLFPCASGKTLVHESPFSIVNLNGTCSLRAPILFCGDVPAIEN